MIVGRYEIIDNVRLFDLANAKGRRETVEWIRDTLTAVQPCWNNFSEDRTRYVVDRLYTELDLPVRRLNKSHHPPALRS